MNTEITYESKKGYNQSSKILAFKLGINASIILSSLIYKHNYWFGENRLIKIENENFFYITYTNLQAETLIKQSAIKKAIVNLKEAGLIKVKRKGVPATNHYSLNEEALNNYESKYESEYLEWIESLNSNAEIDRDRFTKSIKESESELDINLLNSSVNNHSEMELIEQMRNSMGSQIHSSGHI
jgi:transcription initiation factor IIE alpha subunit